jgi:hypothetical protein
MPHSSRFIVLIGLFSVLLLIPGQVQAQILNQDQEIRVHDLPSLTARSHAPADVLGTSLEIIVNDKEICCGKDSALEDTVEAADPKSLKDVAARLNGRHLLSDGRPFSIDAEYRSADAVNGGDLIGAITNQHAALLAWNGHLYVLYGVVYVWYPTNSGTEGGMSEATAIHKLLLWDTRFSNSNARRTVVFDRTTDDWSKVQGVLFLKAIQR